MLEARIQQQFYDSAELQYAAAEALAKPVADAAQALVGCLTAGGKVLACGAGASAALARHFARQLVGRFERERPGLAALALALEPDFAQQVGALGAPGDLLLAIVGTGADASAASALAAAVRAAKAKDMLVVLLGGADAATSGAASGTPLAETDVRIAVAHPRAARVHEVHLLVVHCLCDAVDLQLLGEEESA